MIYKALGTSTVQVSEIGLGTFNYKGGVEPLRAGIERGVSLIDTAESYGTEEIVGDAIRNYRNRVFLASKVSPINFRREALLAAAARSLNRLNTDYIDLYQLHRPNYTVPIHETMGAMEELVEEGKIRFIGASNFSVAELREVQSALSKQRIVSNQVRYSLVERSIEPDLLSFCQEQQITIIAYSPLARGLTYIRQRDPDGHLLRVAMMRGKTEAQVALNWCVSKNAVIAIPKADSKNHVLEDCAASDWRLSQDQIMTLDSKIRFRRRGAREAELRRLARVVLQKIGYQEAFLP
jgi:diketogulonate reductase-like aldo/keto reductase